MESQQYTNQDWVLFKSKVPVWQEAYMERLTVEYTALLASSEKASDKFWALEKRIKEDKRKTGVCVDMRRSMLVFNLLSLLNEDAISLDDLAGFSDQLKETIHMFLRRTE